MIKETTDTFYVNVYRKSSGGYMFGDNMIDHKGIIEAITSSRCDLDYACIMRMDIRTKEYEDGSKVTEIISKGIADEDDEI